VFSASLHPLLEMHGGCKVSNKVLCIISDTKAFNTELNGIMEIFNTLFKGKYTLNALVRIP